MVSSQRVVVTGSRFLFSLLSWDSTLFTVMFHGEICVPKNLLGHYNNKSKVS